ncbi:MAG: zinc ribbon domain-containing protein [Geobacteraceae bacterium]|nr:zinc ribbon domain-containing protein [Geobacteraceae bacterium]
MPIFEYSCITCGCQFEKLQKDSNSQPTGCPACGSAEIKKEFSTFSSAGAVSSSKACFSGG